MHKMPAGPTAYVDVDDTLIVWDDKLGEKHDLPKVGIECRGIYETYHINPHNIKYLKKLATRGHAIFVWSAGGSDWAEAVIQALSLEQYVWAVGSKATYYVDDIKDPAKVLGKYKFYDVDGTNMEGK